MRCKIIPNKNNIINVNVKLNFANHAIKYAPIIVSKTSTTAIPKI
jgi:hypothetical protein